MPRGVAVANIYVVNQLLNLMLMVDNFLQLLILILIEDQLMLFMFYLEKRKIVECNMLDKLVETLFLVIFLLVRAFSIAAYPVR